MCQKNILNTNQEPIIKEEEFILPAEDPHADPMVEGEENNGESPFFQLKFGHMNVGNPNGEPVDPNAPTQILVIDLGAGTVNEIVNAIVRWGIGDRRGFIRHEVENQNGRLVSTRAFEGTDERVATNNEPTAETEQSASPQLPVFDDSNKENEQ